MCFVRDWFYSKTNVKPMVFHVLRSLIKRGLHRVRKPNETLKESFANPKFLLFRVLLQGCNNVLHMCIQIVVHA